MKKTHPNRLPNLPFVSFCSNSWGQGWQNQTAGALFLCSKKALNQYRIRAYVTEKERFELSRRLTRPTPLAGAPLRPLEYFSVVLPRAADCRTRNTHIIHDAGRFVKRFLKKRRKRQLLFCRGAHDPRLNSVCLLKSRPEKCRLHILS